MPKTSRRKSNIRIKRVIADRKANLEWQDIYATFTLAGSFGNTPPGLGFTTQSREGLRRALNQSFADYSGTLSPAEMGDAKRVGDLYRLMWASIPARNREVPR